MISGVYNKIYYNNTLNLNKSVNKAPKPAINHNNNCLSYFEIPNNVINFRSINNIKKLSQKSPEYFPQIQSIDEYNEVLRRVFNSKTVDGGKFWSVDGDYPLYHKVPNEYMGLLPYCGNNDVSYYINSYLSGRLNNKNDYIPTEQSITDIIRALDYSLKALDKNFGKYSGIVYRKGHFEEINKQYVSTSKSPAITASFNGFNPKSDYSVIKINNGHKIFDFQKLAKSSYANAEQEILMDRNSKFRLLQPDEFDEEINISKLNLAKNMYIESNYPRSFIHPKNTHYSFQDALDKIKVYEEI